MSQFSVFVISLQRAVDRREALKTNFHKLGFSFRYVDAIDASAHSSNEIENLIWEPRRVWKNYLRPGAVCCALSHLKAYSEFLRSDLNSCLILEDDVALNRSNLERLCAIKGNLPDIVLLNSYSSAKITVHKDTRIENMYACRDDHPSSAAAYIINRRAASAILKYNAPVKATADQWDEFSKLGLKVGLIKPDIFDLRHAESTIDYYSSPLKYLIPESIRRIRRVLSHRAKTHNLKLSDQ